MLRSVRFVFCNFKNQLQFKTIKTVHVCSLTQNNTQSRHISLRTDFATLSGVCECTVNWNFQKREKREMGKKAGVGGFVMTLHWLVSCYRAFVSEKV